MIVLPSNIPSIIPSNHPTINPTINPTLITLLPTGCLFFVISIYMYIPYLVRININNLRNTSIYPSFIPIIHPSLMQPYIHP